MINSMVFASREGNLFSLLQALARRERRDTNAVGRWDSTRAQRLSEGVLQRMTGANVERSLRLMIQLDITGIRSSERGHLSFGQIGGSERGRMRGQRGLPLYGDEGGRCQLGCPGVDHHRSYQ